MCRMCVDIFEALKRILCAFYFDDPRVERTVSAHMDDYEITHLKHSRILDISHKTCEEHSKKQ